MPDTVEITTGRVTMWLRGPCLADPAPDVRAALQRIATLIQTIAGTQPPDGRAQLADQIRGIHEPGIDDWDDEHRPTHASCTACAEPRWTDPEDNEDPDDVPLMWRTWPCPTIRALGHPWTSPDWRPHNAAERPAEDVAGEDTNDTTTGPQRACGDVWAATSTDPTGQTIHLAPLQPPAAGTSDGASDAQQDPGDADA